MWMTDLEKQVLLNNQADNPPGRPTRPCETNSNKTLHCALVQLLVACPTVHTSRLDQTRPKPTKREFLWNAFLRLRPVRALSSLHLQWASIFLVKILCICNWKKERNGYFQKNQFICPHHARQKSTIRTAAWVYFASLGRFGARLKKNEEGGSGKNFFLPRCRA